MGSKRLETRDTQAAAVGSEGRDDHFESLVENHARLMASAVRRVCGRDHQSLVPDVEQEVRLALWRRLGRGGAIEHPVAYLYKMALTTALQVLRRLRPEEVSVEDPSEFETAVTGEADRREERLVLDQLIDRLDPDQARALRAYRNGLNHREVAALFGWSESVARHRIYRGIAALEKLGREVSA